MEQLPIGRTQTKIVSPSAQRGVGGRRAVHGAAAVLLLLIAVTLAGPPSAFLTRVAAQSATLVPGSTYTVQPGDSWTSLARRTGLTIRQLQAANPQAVRDSGWLIVGEELVIPGASAAATATRTPAATPTAAATATETQAATPEATAETAATEPATESPTATEAATETATGEQTYVVQPGESWNSIAQKFGISADALRAANPQAVRPGLVLFRNEELTIPSATGSTPQPTSQPTAEVEPTATAAATTEGAVDATPATEEPATEEPAAEPSCPNQFVLFPVQLEELAAVGDIEQVLEFLRTCDVLDDANVRSGDWNGDGVDDWAITLLNPRSDSATPETELLVFMSGDGGYSLSFQARPAGKVSLLAAEDINLDGKPDLAWVDTTCGASTCFDTVAVRSWDGREWADWTDSTIVMAYAEIKLDEVRDTAQGREIVLNGGEYGSVGAGPQRIRTETWGSVDGAPFRLLDKVYERSNCLYFKVLDANEALTRVKEIGLVQAREMYNEAVTNRNLVKCGTRDNELDELRSFSLFRLAVVYAYEGDAALAAETVAQLSEAYPDSPYAGMAEAWLAAYEQRGDPADACAAATTYAEQYPESYEALSDYGYANPSFTAADLCPVLDTATTALPEASTPVTATTDVGATESITPLLTLTATTDTTSVAPVVPGQAGELPDCPTTLDGYATALPQVIAVSESDPLVVETWLRLCDGMADDRGGMLLEDFNNDGVEDALFLPTIVSDLGFGPGGAQGALLIYHGTDDGSYELIDAPAVYGQPTLLAADDLNGDGQLDIAWTIEGCSTFCVKEVQVVTWDPQSSSYVSIIEPGATIAEGTAEIVELPEGAPGQGKQLILRGGVSGTSEGGIEIEHEEAWQSIDGRAFRRLSWTYDRENGNSNCLGLRLVEADAALHAADVLGYAPAIELYRAALDPALNACSIFGVPAPEELKLLQGLAMFRLVQAQALAGDNAAAEQDLAALQQGQPESAFATAAQQWLAAYTEGKNAMDACSDLQPLFDKETLTWQITDHFGYNHPALAPEQVCFAPRVEE